MPLLSATLATAIRFYTEPVGGTVPLMGWPADNEAVAENWAAILDTYFFGIVNPPTIPSTLPAAHELFVPSMKAVLDGDASAGLLALEAGLAAYAGMVAFTAPTSVPPIAPPVWPALANTSDAVTAADALATAIDTWARTGLGPVVPPAAPWS